MKAKQCDECQHFDGERWNHKDGPCTKGHRPRFYKPLTFSQAHSSSWGWKRKCEDFERKEK